MFFPTPPPLCSNAVDYHRRRFPDVDAEVRTIMEKAVRPLENTAWRRAVEGVEEKIWRDGKLVQVKVKPSDAMLRLLLQASNPKKYGRLSRGGETKKQIEKRLRKAIRAELLEKMRPVPIEQMRDEVIARLAALRRHRLEQGGGSGGGGGEGGEGG